MEAPRQVERMRQALRVQMVKPQLTYRLGRLVMEELFTLKSLLLDGNISGALAIVEELEEMSRDDKINGSF